MFSEEKYKRIYYYIKHNYLSIVIYMVIMIKCGPEWTPSLDTTSACHGSARPACPCPACSHPSHAAPTPLTLASRPKDEDDDDGCYGSGDGDGGGYGGPVFSNSGR